MTNGRCASATVGLHSTALALPQHVNSSISSPAARIKRVLVIHYSQTGQLGSVAEQIVAPLRADPGISVHVETLRPLADFPFPWPFLAFFDAFPESAHMKPPPLAPLSLTGDEDFDLVILPYQVWFLAPSQPVVAFLKPGEKETRLPRFRRRRRWLAPGRRSPARAARSPLRPT